MKKYPLGFVIIKWKAGNSSQAIIYQDSIGNQCIQCANWISSPNEMNWLCNFEDQIENIITDIDDIHMFLANGDY